MDVLEPDAIENGLWLGREPRSPEDFAALKALGVTDVLTLIPEEEARTSGLQPVVAFRLAVAHGMVLHRCGITDFSHRALAGRLPEAVGVLARLRSGGRRVYCHCAAGMNRSPSVVAAYLGSTRGLAARDACAQVQALHPCAPDVDAVKSFLKR